MSIRGKVYDVTAYTEFHPGGAEELMRGAGLDATELFAEAHAWVNYEAMLESSLLGDLDEAAPDHGTAGGAPEDPAPVAAAAADAGRRDDDGAAPGPAHASAAAPPAAPPSLLGRRSDPASASAWHPLRLVSRMPLARPRWPPGAASSPLAPPPPAAPGAAPCELFRFELPSPEHTLWPADDPAGAHLQVRVRLPAAADPGDAARRAASGQLVAAPGAESVTRELTPVSTPSTAGVLDLAVKLYPRGRMGRVLAGARPGDVVEVRGPRGPFAYRRGRADVGGARGVKVGALLLAGGGSGVTPALQLARAAALDPLDGTPVHLLVCHSSPGASMLVPEAEALAAAHPDQVSVAVAYSTTPGAAEDGSGAAVVTVRPGRPGTAAVVRARMSAALLSAAWPAAAADHVVCWCGPHGFNRAADAAARELFYVAGRMHEF